MSKFAALILACCAMLATACGGEPPEYIVEPVEVDASVVLTKSNDFRIVGNRCKARPTGKYPDIGQGVEVFIDDDSGRPLGEIVLGEGDVTPAPKGQSGLYCSFHGYATGLPKSEFYVFKVIADYPGLTKRVKHRPDEVRTGVEFKLP